MKRRKCIGIFLGQPDLPFQSRVLSCIAKMALQADCNVAVFSNMIFSGGYEEYLAGEEKIIELANFDLLDGVIVLPDTLQIREDYAAYVLKYIQERFDGPRVVLDVEAEGFQAFGCDDEEMICQLVSHLIEVHECRDIAFMTGPEEHPHSLQRLAGYRRALQEHGIVCDESRIFYGDFWYNEGERVVGELQASPKGMPQAIACASDTMAISVCDALRARNLHVPEDVLVTGFDCDGNGISQVRTITSTVRGVEEMVERAMNYIWQQWGYEPLPVLPKENRLLLTYSCGCTRSQSLVRGLMAQESDKSFFSLYNFMPEKLLAVPNIRECLWVVEWYMGSVHDFSRFCVCLCDNWDSMEDEKSGFFAERMYLKLDKCQESGKEYKHVYDQESPFSVKEMLPGLGQEERPTIYYFNVLHFEAHCFGYLALAYSDQAAVQVYDNIYPVWVRNINNALESLRRLYTVRELYVAAEKKAVTDMMTGLYNRNGYNMELSKILSGLQPNEHFLIMLFDNNGLKYVNDTYGHMAGDEVICKSAEIISKTYFPLARVEKNFRIGGDEYVKLAAGELNETMVKVCVSNMRDQLEEFNQRKEKEYPLHLAIGYSLYSLEEIISPDQIMKEVDARMYENKQLLKKTTGFDPKR